jgi:hypothetical protein
MNLQLLIWQPRYLTIVAGWPSALAAFWSSFYLPEWGMDVTGAAPSFQFRYLFLQRSRSFSSIELINSYLLADDSCRHLLLAYI